MRRRIALVLTLTGYLASSTGLALALHQIECEHHAEAHDPLDCLQSDAVHCGYGAPLETPPAPVRLHDTYDTIFAESVDRPAITAFFEVTAARGPPHLHTTT